MEKKKREQTEKEENTDVENRRKKIERETER